MLNRAMLLCSISFQNAFGKQVVIPKGSYISLDLSNGIAYAMNEHFFIKDFEYTLVYMN